MGKNLFEIETGILGITQCHHHLDLLGGEVCIESERSIEQDIGHFVLDTLAANLRGKETHENDTTHDDLRGLRGDLDIGPSLIFAVETIGNLSAQDSESYSEQVAVIARDEGARTDRAVDAGENEGGDGQRRGGHVSSVPDC